MQKQTLTIIVTLAISFSAICQTKNFIDQPYMEVTGRADSMVIPDEIYIKILISERDTKDRISIEETESKMADSLKAMGINVEKDLVTSDLASNFRFYMLKKKDVLKAKQYTLKVSDAVTATKVFIMLEDLDISNSSIERVDHSDLENIKNITMAKAVENAKLKAVTLTKPLNQTVGAAIFIADNQSADAVNYALAGRVAGLQIRGQSFAKYKGDLPKIEFEKIKVSSSVSVKFILK